MSERPRLPVLDASPDEERVHERLPVLDTSPDEERVHERRRLDTPRADNINERRRLPVLDASPDEERVHERRRLDTPRADKINERRRLPVLDASADEEDPLRLLRGGRFARLFAVTLGVLGLLWILSARVDAADAQGATVLVHAALRAEPPSEEHGDPATPAKPAVEELPSRAPAKPAVEELPSRAPPMPAVEELPSRAPPMPAVEELPPREEEYTVDEFGRKRTSSGALVLERDDAPEDRGLTDAQLQAIRGGGFFDPDAFNDVKVVKRKAYVHLMPGIPNEVFFGSAALILLLSFVVFERHGDRNDPRARKRGYLRLELTRGGLARRLLKSRWLQPAVQLPVVIAFVAVIVAGLIGSQEPGRNIAPVLTWNIWWIGLIFAVLLFGNLWCFMCPWTAIPDWVMRGSFVKVKKIRSFARKYPRFRLWMWPAIVLFALVTWLEIVFDAANRPWLTSALAIGMVALSWLLLVVYERKAMCRYVCFVGRVSGQYALMGMLELRRRDDDTCRACATKDCFHGNDRGYPCPTHEFMGAMNENQYCTLCTECVKSCPHDNVTLNARSSGADVLYPHRAKRDEAYLAILIFIVSAFHGAAMIPLWMEWEDALRRALIDAQVAAFGADALGIAGSHGGMITFTLMMLACIVVPGLIFWLLCAAMRAVSGRADVSIRRLFVRLAYTLLPIALFYHLAHNAVHVFWEWSKLRRLISDPLGWGHDLFGTARAPLSALWSPESIWYLQVGLVIIGHIYGIYVAQREAFRVYGGDRKASLRAHLVMMVGMILMSMLSLWLLAQPMFMRTAEL
ncbi:MAG: 4Fe-4S binding protein [Nannocystaceae bacterium]